MDCRKGLVFVLGLLAPLSGCTLHPANEVRKDGAESTIKKPETYVAFADYRAAASFAAETPPEVKASFREEARVGYLKAIELEPKHVPAYLSLARLQQGNKDMIGAVETYKKALEVTTKDATIWYELGMCQARQKEFEAAVASLRNASELRPGDKKCRETLGYTLARAGRPAESLTTLTGVVGEARAHFCLARMLQHMNQPEEAKQHAAAALKLEPDLSGAREMLDSLSDGPYTAPAPAAPAAQAQVLPNNPTPSTDAVPLAPRTVRLPPRPVVTLSATP